MRKWIILSGMIILLSACATSSLYRWDAYEELAYQNYKKQTPQSVCQLICAYETMITHPGGTRQVPPPGICAEYGYLLLKPETAEIFSQYATPAQKKIFEGTDYGSLFQEKGKNLLTKELELYPESKPFVVPLMKKLCP